MRKMATGSKTLRSLKDLRVALKDLRVLHRA